MLRSVYFKPRPSIEPYGTEWMSAAPDFRPHHPEFEQAAVLEGMEERQFMCSDELEVHLDIIPALAARYGAADETLEPILQFAERVRGFIVKRFRALPEEARAQVPLRVKMEDVADESLAYYVMEAPMLSMRSELIEISVWAAMYGDFLAYCGKSPAYLPFFEVMSCTDKRGIFVQNLDRRYSI
ncbi:hypothetical protein B0H16DRAFT_1875934 [Mycena metata]|uniref:Uncharacterized protein n=1 Tax=Mycena metata TaxID=1033252 RepID=A0AAD7P2S4_9AGAR|nr:hypothetical protein B0H16DRAFT_1875934 [Mycena metata]